MTLQLQCVKDKKRIIYDTYTTQQKQEYEIHNQTKKKQKTTYRPSSQSKLDGVQV